MGMSAFRRMRVQRARKEAYERAKAQQDIEKELPTQEAPVDVPVNDTLTEPETVTSVDNEVTSKTTEKKSDAEKMKKKS